MIWLADLLGLLLLVQIFLLGGQEVVTAGGVEYAVAGILVSWAGMAALARRKSPADSGSPIVQVVKIPRVAETFLMAAYIYASTSWLNALAANSDIRLRITSSLLAIVICTPLFFRLARYQDLTTGVLENAKGRKRVRATVAWVLLTVTYTLPLVGGFTVGTFRRETAGRLVTTGGIFDFPELALLWLCFCSVFLAAVLFRPWAMKMSRVAFPVVVTVLGAAAMLEQVWRRNWYLYTLTSLTFLGTALGVWRLVDSFYSANVRLSANQPAPTNPPVQHAILPSH